MPKAVQPPKPNGAFVPAGANLLSNLRLSNQNAKITINAVSPHKDFEPTSTRCTSTVDDRSDNSFEKPEKQTCATADFYFSGSEPNSATKNFQASSKYKTEICKNFELHGYCKWGNGCCFAHGRDELRNKTLFNYFYKTKVCKHFHKHGFCPYASRCQYFHFKSNQVYQELLDSHEKKMSIRMAEDSSCDLEAMLDKNERSLGRLSVFKQLFAAETKKSLYEKYLDDCY